MNVAVFVWEPVVHNVLRSFDGQRSMAHLLVFPMLCGLPTGTRHIHPMPLLIPRLPLPHC
jgi:hypothetical protein